MENYHVHYLRELEAESIYIIREAVAEFKNPVMLYSIGKDSSVMLHLARKAFAPGRIPFPLMHIDTGYKFKEMIEFRDYYTQKMGIRLLVERNEEMIGKGMHPSLYGTDRCCGFLKTKALLSALSKHRFDAAFGGARREEEKSRAKERIFSVRNEFGVWDPKNQRPELWHLYNCKLRGDETMRVFPLSNWTEGDVWAYIRLENIEVVPLYFAKERQIVRRGGVVIPVDESTRLKAGEKIEKKMIRFRSLGCSPCTGAIESKAQTIDEILMEVLETKRSERENRVIDFGSDSSMEEKKREGYF
jgi:sulfate adenylyltransferase subunit 2